jgi:hypothetical protein
MDSYRIVQIVNKFDLIIIGDGEIIIPNNIINISNKYDLYIKSGKNNIFLICKEDFIIPHSTLEFTTIRFSTVKLLNKKGKRKLKLLFIENLLNH